MHRFSLLLIFLFLVSGAGLFAVQQHQLTGVVWTVAIIGCAVLAQRSSQWKPFAFSCWVLAVVLVALSYPAIFRNWGPIEPAKTISPLIQLIMFGMGATLSIEDFRRVLSEPKKVAIGMLLQFSVMPLTGWLLTCVFHLPPEIAAGVVLIGSCPGGVASNVITYLARGNVALSVTMTACSTLMSPVMTPLCMKLLAGELIEVSFVEMFLDILSLVIVPVVGGLLFHIVLEKKNWHGEWVDRILSLGAMVAICIVIGIIVARSRDKLLYVGPVVLVVAIIHNAVGYLLGYAGAKWFGMNQADCRTVSIEVGMQNGGMASALATNVLNSPDAAIAGTIFGPWMSIAGAVLASWWRRQDESSKKP
jgi:bile acid:Na+ symporter, BASS family